ncbi:MAG: hypothetical protein MI867_03665, partial [Pseudomonadales bacterium]|nr:hypothetical protein [Pseudomonadales bacterium]
RLLLGPRYILESYRPEIPPPPAFADRVLLDLGDDGEKIAPMMAALSVTGFRGKVYILCSRGSGAFELLGARSAQWPHLEPIPVHLFAEGPLDFNNMPLIITAADHLCTRFAARGLVFATIALEKDQLHRSYALEQLGVAVSFGWYGSCVPETASARLQPLLTDASVRRAYAEAGPKLVAGDSLDRIARFFPAEKADLSS